MKALFNGKEIDIELSEKAKKELKELKEDICKDCPLRKECKEKGERCLIQV
jgi:hypothetical protein